MPNFPTERLEYIDAGTELGPDVTRETLVTVPEITQAEAQTCLADTRRAADDALVSGQNAQQAIQEAEQAMRTANRMANLVVTLAVVGGGALAWLGQGRTGGEGVG
ncbi:unnamed protein product [Zymoseptoria tritici ST99CH_1E4]|uniref:Uncharacterized protein n=1 Tax=Zymoseptoria tritici ST99CH_1E4 TaxID=1276532 RepID=A0A2H1H9Z8_ZYMTR|nr:unnamed protein product [Zymoseptoria tritici ST99CH_1E4]